VRFVRRFGFPDSYAGRPASENREPSLTVDGPLVLSNTHDYQRELIDRVKQLGGGSGPSRGLVCLPTGAGKTRVAVQALVERATNGLAWPVVWVAQTDELCEQAVQSWRNTWRAAGPADTPLTISRLWQSNPVEQEAGCQVVVASIQSLTNLATRNDSSYNWLRQPGFVVIDEAHRSVTPSYTRSLEWLGITRRETAAPLLGLSATPARTDDDESRRLVGRYHDHLIVAPSLGRDYAEALDELRRGGFLAHAGHEMWEGIRVNVSDAELAEAKQSAFDELPRSVERRLEASARRNEKIVQAVLAHLPGPVLLFAISVEHARTLAAVLSGRHDVPAMAIDGKTHRAARREAVDRLRSGSLQVVTNYNVLSEGFDAPGVSTVVVARPTFSPNRYVQMIGRGMRGPANGGSPTCTIVDVQDNLLRWPGQYAFTRFEAYWSRPD
jgi:superfamily II DNA or RNA helicase